ncbi:endopeptidase [Rhodoferax sp.]|uniref:Bbp19 family protein n=1 Tax=Rhodoferax sp. TaxID=50421 RepID=UPI002ACDF904|nr:endopeptidase [Rhodoferax sp.]MDZ7918508.1 endopeptidase [Rhodoferax sp.]
MTDHNPLDVEGQGKATKDREKRESNEAKTEAADIAWLMSSKRGRRIVWRQLARAGVFRISFNTNSMTMAFNEGARNEGVRMLPMLPPDLYVEMIKESKE